MGDGASGLSGLEYFFLGCAVFGGGMVLFKLFAQFIGGDGIDDAGGDSGHSDSDAGFTLLSIFGFSSFLMMFGLVGLALSRQSEAGAALSMAGAVAAGIFSTWLIRKLFRLAIRLQSSGTLDITDAVGCSGIVYLRIPAQGAGRVSLKFHNHLREYDAASADGMEIATGTPVKVIKVTGATLIVETL